MVDDVVEGRGDVEGQGDVVLSVRGLVVEFVNRRRVGRAVNGVSFDLRRGETLALVGESGSGKSVTSLGVMGVLPDSARVVSGEVLFEGEDLLKKSAHELRAMRGRDLSMVLQDPLGALNPSFTIEHQLTASLRMHTDLRGKGLRDRAVELLRLMRIPKPEDRLDAYPHQFSGGMRQRVVSAIALSGSPSVMIADEPTTALDVTIQAAYLELLREVKAGTGLSVLFITHDLAVVSNIADNVAVMYAGGIVERASTRELFGRPGHPYTRALLESIPHLERETERLLSIPGFPPSIFEPPSGCKFHDRCWLFEQLGRPERCVTEVPELADTPDGSGSHAVACHFQQDALERDVYPKADQAG